MSGIKDHNRASFAKAWNKFTQAGFDVVSPHFLESVIEIDTRATMGPGHVYRYAIPIDVFAISSVDVCVALPGWEHSKGCKLEKHCAELMHIPWVGMRSRYPEYMNDMSDEDKLNQEIEWAIGRLFAIKGLKDRGNIQ